MERTSATRRAAVTGPQALGVVLLTNFPLRGWLAYEALAAQRPDLIVVSIVGNHDGSSAVD